MVAIASAAPQVQAACGGQLRRRHCQSGSTTSGVPLAVALSIGAAALTSLVYYALSRVWVPTAGQPSYLRVLAIWAYV